MSEVNTVIVKHIPNSPIRTVMVKQTLPDTVRTINVTQIINNPISTAVIRRAETPIKTVVINRGPKGDVGPPGPSGPAVNEIVETVLLSSTNIANKSFPLAHEPENPARIELTPVGGIIQIYGVDYVYSAGNITWTGFGLDGFLETGELVVVRYLKEA